MSEHHHYHNSGGGFFQGLFLGALVGAGLIFFLGTKRGKEIADEIKEKGLSLVDDFDGLLDELEEDTTIDQTPPQPLVSAQKTTVQQEPPTQPPEATQYSDIQSTSNYSTVTVEETKGSNETPLPPHIETLQTHGRRFFHGIPKRR